MIFLEHADGLWSVSLTLSGQTLEHIIYACLLLNVTAGIFWVLQHVYCEADPATLQEALQREEIERWTAQEALRRYYRNLRELERRQQAMRRVRRAYLRRCVRTAKRRKSYGTACCDGASGYTPA